MYPARRNFMSATSALGSFPGMYAYRNLDILRPRAPITKGSAHWATMSDYRRSGRLSPGKGKYKGPILGCLTPAEIGGREIHNVYACGEGHLASIATTATGKSRGQAITNLLWWPGSMVVLDIKNELYEQTAGWRRAAGHRIIKFAPFERGSAKWNLVDAVNDGCGSGFNDPLRQENARYLSKLLITPNIHAKDPYWDNASRTLGQNLAMHVATSPLLQTMLDSGVKEATMTQVFRLMAEQNPMAFKNTLQAMAQSPEDWVRQAACTMMHMESAREQFASVKSILIEHLSTWSLTRVQNVTSSTTLNFELLRDETPTTIYIVIPPDELEDYTVLLRVMIGWCVRKLLRTWSKERDDGRPPVMLMLDEFPQLQYMSCIENSLLYLRSFGVKYWFFVQMIEDLQRHYPNSWRRFLGNCTTSFYGVGDYETAKLVSDLSGTETIPDWSYQVSDTDSRSHTTGTTSGSSCGPGGYSSSSGSSSSDTYGTSSTFGVTKSHVGRPLLMPDEVLRMPFGSVVSFAKGMPPMRMQLRFWDEDPELRRRGLMQPPDNLALLG